MSAVEGGSAMKYEAILRAHYITSHDTTFKTLDPHFIMGARGQVSEERITEK